MKLTLTYQGPLPPTQRGVSPVKARLRRAFHPQLKAALEPRVPALSRAAITSTVFGHEFVTPCIETIATAAELDVLLLTPPSVRIGDADNRLKTLIDGLTRPANRQQMKEFTKADDGGPTFCLLSDDRLVQNVRLDSRPWYGATDPKDSLVVVTATILLSHEVTESTNAASLILLL